MAKLGFLGLGIMGGPMAQRLVEAGHSVAVWSHSTQKAKDLASASGASFCAAPEDVAKNADCVFLCVGDTAMSHEVILGPAGLAKGARRGFTIVDCSTVSAQESMRMASELETHGIDFLDAPCTGSTSGAKSGTLTFMVGGKKEVFERVRPYFEAMGKLLYYCGSSGMGLRGYLPGRISAGLHRGWSKAWRAARCRRRSCWRPDTSCHAWSC